MFENICQAIEEINGSQLHEQRWTRDETGQWIQGENSNGIIYIDKALRNGNVFEKVGINYVSMQGELPPGITFQGSDAVMAAPGNGTASESTPFFATSTLLHDRGVRFGLASGIVNTQSVLNCMPGEANCNYNDQPAADSQEALLLEVVRNPRE